MKTEIIPSLVYGECLMNGNVPSCDFLTDIPLIFPQFFCPSPELTKTPVPYNKSEFKDTNFHRDTPLELEKQYLRSERHCVSVTEATFHLLIIQPP
jgi:hypothetical protein